MDINDLEVGGRYNWKYQPERLVYLGKHGHWHQFALVGDESRVWCEVEDDQIEYFEKTPEKPREPVVPLAMGKRTQHG